MISKNEQAMVEYINKDTGRAVAVITSKYPGDVFFFYECVDGEFRKLGKANSPIELEIRYDVRGRMGMSDE